MAIKGDRKILDTEISYTCRSAASAGSVLVVYTAGSGASLGATAGVADLVANPSGYKVAGVLYHDVVDKDLTQTHLNFHNGESKIGNRCTLVTKGWLHTDKVTGTPTDGDTAYLTTSGVVTPTMSSTGGLVATPKVGVFKSSKDENGYAKVEYTLPIA